jgi:hypothetical protein
MSTNKGATQQRSRSNKIREKFFSNHVKSTPMKVGNNYTPNELANLNKLTNQRLERASAPLPSNDAVEIHTRQHANSDPFPVQNANRSRKNAHNNFSEIIKLGTSRKNLAKHREYNQLIQNKSKKNTIYKITMNKLQSNYKEKTYSLKTEKELIGDIAFNINQIKMIITANFINQFKTKNTPNSNLNKEIDRYDAKLLEYKDNIDQDFKMFLNGFKNSSNNISTKKIDQFYKKLLNLEQNIRQFNLDFYATMLITFKIQVNHDYDSGIEFLYKQIKDAYGNLEALRILKLVR